MRIEYEPIGTFHTPFTRARGMPVQPSGANGVRGTIEIEPRFHDGLRDLDGFSHVIVLYHLHRIEGYELIVTPYLDTEQHGIFATRSPRRPNPIGLSVLHLERIENGTLFVEGVDVLDGTPVLDLKPFVPDFDARDVLRLGWLEMVSGDARHRRSDGRFHPDE